MAQNPWDLLAAIPSDPVDPSPVIAVPSPWDQKPAPAPEPAPAPITLPTPKPTPPAPSTPTGPAPTATGSYPAGGVSLTPNFDYKNLWERTRDPATYVREVINQLKLTGRQSDPNATGIKEIIKALQAVGINAQMPAQPSSGGMNKGIVIDGRFIKLLDGSDNWIWGEGADSEAPPPGTTVPGLPIGGTPPNQFDDPTTKYLEDFLKGRLDELNAPVYDESRDKLAKLLDEQVSRYGGFLDEQQGTNAALKARQAAANTSADEYIAYLKSHAAELQKLPPEVQQAYDQLVTGTNARITDLSQLPPELQQALDRYRTSTSTRIQDLQNLPRDLANALEEYVGQTNARMEQLRAPAYTGTEQEILRTQALDPIENDRAAAKARDLARIGNTGMLPSSGIALALQGETDRFYDRQRNTAQGDIAAKQIAERRNRDAEIQRLAEGLFGTKAGVSATGEERKAQAQQLLEALTQTEQGAVAFQDERGGQAQDLRTVLMDAAKDKTGLQDARRLKAGELLGSIPDIQRTGVASDLALSNEMQAAIERITQGQIAAAGQRTGLNEQVRGDETVRRQEALTLASILQQLPTAAMQQAMAAIGQAPNPESMINQLITLFGIEQTTRNQNAQYYTSLGQSLPYLASAFAPKSTPKVGGTQLPGGGQALM